MIEIDGSEGEGGGQMLRSSLTLSIITGQPFKIVNIRANRPKPGLAAQHLACVKAAAAISSAHYKGASIGSTVVYFEPKAVKPGPYHFTVGTAGATGLVLQTIALPLAFGPLGSSEVTIQGGTHVAHAPCFDYLDTTWCAYLRAMGLDVNITMARPGFYPRGGGEIQVKFSPRPEVKSLRLMTKSPVSMVSILSVVADLPESIAHKQSQRMTKQLKPLGIDSQTTLETWKNGPSSMVTVTCRQCEIPTLFFGLGERGKPAEFVADDAFDQLDTWAKGDAPVDPHSADQIILPLVFASGASEFRTSEITQHLLTNIEVIRRFTDREISITGQKGEPGVVSIADRGVR
jgi:RNA 3'-phosphate cyclase